MEAKEQNDIKYLHLRKLLLLYYNIPWKNEMQKENIYHIYKLKRKGSSYRRKQSVAMPNRLELH